MFFLIFDELADGNLQWTGKSRRSVDQLNIVESTPVLNLLLEKRASEFLG